MIINPNFITKVIAMLLGITIISVTLAHQGATGIVKERMDMMKSMGDANKAIGDMIKGKTTFDAAQIAEHARTINRQSQDILGHFPEGSLQKVSEALPQIWEDWPRFEHITQQLQTESAALVDIAANGGDKRAVMRQFAEMGKTCARFSY
jgi:cytochrome c556